MTGLLAKLFGCSFDALDAYEKTVAFEEWVSAKNKINLEMNTLVFTHLSRTRAGENAQAQQFYVDAVSSLLKKHYTRRLKIYNAVKKRQLFVITCVLIAWVDTLARLLLSLSRFQYRFFLQNEVKVAETDVCIRFPQHAFSYEAGSVSHSRSFAEFLVSVEYAGLGFQHMLSVDEYERASKKHERGRPGDFVQPDVYPHEPALLVRTKQSFGKAAAEFRSVRGSFRNMIARRNLFLLQEYFSQYHVSKKYVSVFEQLEQRKVSVRRIYVMSFFDIGVLKYGSVYNDRIRVFSYSQNLFVPPAPAISAALLTGVVDVTLKQAFEECETLLFSYYTHNHIGLTEHSYALNYFKSLINREFGLSLPVNLNRLKSEPANGSYESLFNIEINDTIKNIMLFDVPNESTERGIARTSVGDKAASEEIVRAFYNDIVSLAMKYNCRMLLKPKYSLSSPDFPASYTALLREVQEKAGDQFVVLDPYVALNTVGGKIDLGISFPFTSTFYTTASICKRSVFYAPTNFETAFAKGLGTKLVLGKGDLENIIQSL